MKNKIKVEKKIHQGYLEFEKVRKIKSYVRELSGLRQLFGKWHYLYSSPKGKISLVLLKDYFYDKKDLWEIYSLEGKLFVDTERFNTRKEAVKRIKELLW